MVVRSSRGNGVTENREPGGECLGVEDDLFGVLLEGGLQGFVEADGLCRDHLHERAALNTREDLRIDFLRILFLAENQTGAGAAEALVGGGGDEVREGDRIGMDPAGYEPRDVGHVDEEKGPDGIGDCAEALEIDAARVGGGPGRDHFRHDFARLPGEGVIVDPAIVRGDAVVDDLVELAGKVRLVPVGEVAAVGQIHGEDAVARFEDAEIDGHVCLTAAVRLDIRMIGTEKFFRPLDGERLHRVDMLAAAVPAAPRISLGVFVGQARSLRLHHGPAGEVLRGDELYVLKLAVMFGGDGSGNLRVCEREGSGGINGCGAVG